MSRRVHSFAAVATLAFIATACSSDVDDGEIYDEGESAVGSRPIPRPTNDERTLGCPIVSTVSAGFADSSRPIVFDTEALNGVVGTNVKVSVILIRRVNGVPMYRYLSNGTQDTAFETWSSSKFLGVAAAGAKLRKKSGGSVGLTAKTGGIPLGDLVTVIASYREDRYTSNALAQFFLNTASRPDAKALVRGWLGRPTSETYGGRYGSKAPALSYTFKESDGSSVSVSPDEQVGPDNTLSTRTLAEGLKRLVMWDDEATRLPDLQKEDVETLLYGPEDSKWYPSDPFGGLSADSAGHAHYGLDMAKVEAESKGRWRIFAKFGAGFSSIRNQHERTNVSYVCLPVLDAELEPIPNQGAEFVIASRQVTQSQSVVDDAYKKIFNQVVLRQAQSPDPPTP